MDRSASEAVKAASAQENQSRFQEYTCRMVVPRSRKAGFKILPLALRAPCLYHGQGGCGDNAQLAMGLAQGLLNELGRGAAGKDEAQVARAFRQRNNLRTARTHTNRATAHRRGASQSNWSKSECEPIQNQTTVEPLMTPTVR
jgi:hypothetical protein